MKIKVKVTSDNISLFVDLCNTFKSDIDLSKDHYITDGKSYLGVSTLIGSICYATINSNNNKEIERFNKEMRMFKCD